MIGEVTCHGVWRVTNYLRHDTNLYHDIGFLNVLEDDNEINYKGVAACVYSKLPKGPDYNRQCDVVIMGKRDIIFLRQEGTTILAFYKDDEGAMAK